MLALNIYNISCFSFFLSIFLTKASIFCVFELHSQALVPGYQIFFDLLYLGGPPFSTPPLYFALLSPDLCSILPNICIPTFYRIIVQLFLVSIFCFPILSHGFTISEKVFSHFYCDAYFEFSTLLFLLYPFPVIKICTSKSVRLLGCML